MLRGEVAEACRWLQPAVSRSSPGCTRGEGQRGFSLCSPSYKKRGRGRRQRSHFLAAGFAKFDWLLSRSCTVAYVDPASSSDRSPPRPGTATSELHSQGKTQIVSCCGRSIDSCLLAFPSHLAALLTPNGLRPRTATHRDA